MTWPGRWVQGDGPGEPGTMGAGHWGLSRSGAGGTMGCLHPKVPLWQHHPWRTTESFQVWPGGTEARSGPRGRRRQSTRLVCVQPQADMCTDPGTKQWPAQYNAKVSDCAGGQAPGHSVQEGAGMAAALFPIHPGDPQWTLLPTLTALGPKGLEIWSPPKLPVP